MTIIEFLWLMNGLGWGFIMGYIFGIIQTLRRHNLLEAA